MKQYKHDCDQCIFLGNSEDGKKDLYFCMQGGNFPTVIARFSSRGPDYISGLVFAEHDVDIARAKHLAEEMGLV